MSGGETTAQPLIHAKHAQQRSNVGVHDIVDDESFAIFSGRNFIRKQQAKRL